MSYPNLSIIIPTRNGAQTLPELLAMLSVQTIPIKELIINANIIPCPILKGPLSPYHLMVLVVLLFAFLLLIFPLGDRPLFGKNKNHQF